MEDLKRTDREPFGSVIDAHQHIWDPITGWYPWLRPQSPLYRAFTFDELRPELVKAGVDRTVMVQSANCLAETEFMLHTARDESAVAGVVGWVPLDNPAETISALDRFSVHATFCGVRHLIHEEPDPDWVIRPQVVDGLRLVAQRGFTFDVVAVTPRHLKHVATLAQLIPTLKMVIDHLGKPPIRAGAWQPWRSLIAQAAEHQNVTAKISGLNTAADHQRWNADDLRPYLGAALDLFGPDRLMFGGDWPVTLLAGGYQKVWRHTRAALSELTPASHAAIFGGTAARFYRLAMCAGDRPHAGGGRSGRRRVQHDPPGEPHVGAPRSNRALPR